MDRIWEILKINATGDKSEIKKAYARLSKEIHPEDSNHQYMCSGWPGTGNADCGTVYGAVGNIGRASG